MKIVFLFTLYGKSFPNIYKRKWIFFKTGNNIYFRYTIGDDKDSSLFKLSAILGVCLDSNGPCNPVIPFLDKFPVPKPLCNWDMGFQLPGKSSY
jgi:hypothetical protein